MSEYATDVLRYEHRLILMVVDAFETTLLPLHDGTADIDLVSDCIAFFRLFADACHHAKEEALLFSELEETGMPRDAGPIAVMLAEHRRGRELVRRMAETLLGVRSSPDSRRAFIDAAQSYVDLIRGHIGKEDGILFQIADSAILGTACQTLCERYREADACGFESRSKADLETLAHRIVARA